MTHGHVCRPRTAETAGNPITGSVISRVSSNHHDPVLLQRSQQRAGSPKPTATREDRDSVPSSRALPILGTSCSTMSAEPPRPVASRGTLNLHFFNHYFTKTGPSPPPSHAGSASGRSLSPRAAARTPRALQLPGPAAGAEQRSPRPGPGSGSPAGSAEPTPGGLGNSPAVPAGYARPEEAAQPGRSPAPPGTPVPQPHRAHPGPTSGQGHGGGPAAPGLSAAPGGVRPSATAAGEQATDGRLRPPRGGIGQRREGGVVTASAGRASRFSGTAGRVK